MPAKSPKATPLDHLIGNKEKQVPGRRPDLAHIKLTCENTENAMPYVDLVNEILESYVLYQQSLPTHPGPTA